MYKNVSGYVLLGEGRQFYGVEERKRCLVSQPFSCRKRKYGIRNIALLFALYICYFNDERQIYAVKIPNHSSDSENSC